MSITINRQSLTIIGRGYYDEAQDSGEGSGDYAIVPYEGDVTSLAKALGEYEGIYIDPNAIDPSILTNCMSEHADVGNVLYRGDGLTYVKLIALAYVGQCLYDAGAFSKHTGENEFGVTPFFFSPARGLADTRGDSLSVSGAEYSVLSYDSNASQPYFYMAVSANNNDIQFNVVGYPGGYGYAVSIYTYAFTHDGKTAFFKSGTFQDFFAISPVDNNEWENGELIGQCAWLMLYGENTESGMAGVTYDDAAAAIDWTQADPYDILDDIIAAFPGIVAAEYNPTGDPDDWYIGLNI